MKVTKDGIKDRQPHIEDYLQMVSAEQEEYAEVFAHQRIAENNDIITDFQTDKLMEKILSNDNLNQAYLHPHSISWSIRHTKAAIKSLLIPLIYCMIRIMLSYKALTRHWKSYYKIQEDIP